QADGNGNVLLRAQGSGADVNLNAGVQSSGGSISVLAADTVNQTSDITTASSGSIDVEAAAGSITMAGQARAVTASGSIRYYASLNVVLGGLNSGSGAVSVTALGGSILDGGDNYTNASGAALRLFAGVGI